MSDSVLHELKRVEQRLFDQMVMTPALSAKRHRLSEQYWAAYKVRKEWEATHD